MDPETILNRRTPKDPREVNLGLIVKLIEKEVRFVRKISTINKAKLNTPFQTGKALYR
jgi:hypothetical protein